MVPSLVPIGEWGRGSLVVSETIDPRQRDLATAAEELGRLLEQAADAHELEDSVRRDTWRRLSEVAAQVAALASLLAGDDVT